MTVLEMSFGSRWRKLQMEANRRKCWEAQPAGWTRRALEAFLLAGLRHLHQPGG